ncbi:methyl-accepting chemotaxis protein [Oceanospirillum beijerinckii]|uniref:methyl-accepting chemotaxis protein n=1 Tax=Oceanospirillum beijerinckii TaxID=64976 RepID=UPI000428576D|nr:methyl-accepting chemotaxis protein [Oceanospirillum beijerinckii]
MSHTARSNISLLRYLASLPLLAALIYGVFSGGLSWGFALLLLLLSLVAVVPIFRHSGGGLFNRPEVQQLVQKEHLSVSDMNQLADHLRHFGQQRSPEGQILNGYIGLRNMAHNLAPVSSKTAIATAEVSFLADQMDKHLDIQQEEVEKAAERLESITVTMHQVSVNASNVTQLATDAKNASFTGRDDLQQAMVQMRDISDRTGHTLALINELNDKSNRIQDVTKVIEGIAEQTNLLALNAAIEAARAGEYGRGFAVVADEVRSLASRTSDSTQQVAEIVEEIQSSTQDVVGTIEDLVSRITLGTEKVELVGNRLGEMANQFDEVEDQISGIAEAVGSSYQHVEDISRSIGALKEEVTEGNDQMHTLSQQADQLMHGAEQITAELARHTAEGKHRQAYLDCLEAVERITQAFEQGIKNGEITLQALFDRRYQPLPGTKMGRCTSSYVGFADKVLPAILEDIFQRGKYGYAILIDDHCYIPTHNAPYSHPESGDPEVDAVKCRDKRIFDSEVGIRGAKVKEALLLQTYKRDTGEVLHDLSVPVVLDGRHWGAFRVGYLPEA